jgi:hypothetical protein
MTNCDDVQPDAPAPAVLIVDVGGLGELDIVDIGALVHLQLVARRFGASIQLCNARGNLEDLLALTGLDTVLPCGPSELGECVGHPEVREQVRVDEEVDPVDPAV